MTTNQQMMFPDLDPDRTAQIAHHFDVSPSIHRKDYLMHYLYNKSIIQGDETAVLNYYFSNARDCMRNLETVIELAYRRDQTVPDRFKLLEFASGYGRLTRHLVNDNRFALSCCDIHPEAIDFLQQELEVEAFNSTASPTDFSTPALYDIVFALSFFSHIPKKYWKNWLTALFDSVEPGGLLIFTTHGQSSRNKHYPQKEFDSDGFHFHTDTDQEDIDTEFYGTAITLPKFVQNQLDEDMQLSVFIEGFWWSHQDVFAIRKPM